MLLELPICSTPFLFNSDVISVRRRCASLTHEVFSWLISLDFLNVPAWHCPRSCLITGIRIASTSCRKIPIKQLISCLPPVIHRAWLWAKGLKISALPPSLSLLHCCCVPKAATPARESEVVNWSWSDGCAGESSTAVSQPFTLLSFVYAWYV